MRDEKQLPAVTHARLSMQTHMNNIPSQYAHSMTPQIQLKGFPVHPSLRAWLQAGLQDLQKLTVITAADVRLERMAGASPAMQAHVHLAIAGPDLHVTTRDHTIETVWHKVLKNLKSQIARRKAKLHGRHKGTQLVHGPENRHSRSTVQG